jgi:agmatine deiminase
MILNRIPDLILNYMTEKVQIVLPGEWAEQDAVMLTWPGVHTDWADIIDEAEGTYISLASEIVCRQDLLIVCDDVDRVRNFFTSAQQQRIRFFELPFNDTWARDHGPVGTYNNGQPMVNDFGFNGWGGKFDASLDNQLTSALFNLKAFAGDVQYKNCRDFILEGGSIESDGMGTLLTTSACLLNPNRNPDWSKSTIENKLSEILGLHRVLWLDYGHIEGDDTDSHIDTLARFCDENTIAYVQCTDESDPHYSDLNRMEKQLSTFVNNYGEPYRLVALPMASPVYHADGQRMGATYANFLIINGAVLVPVYGVPEDEQALGILADIFSDRQVVGINCLPLIKQNGSLHCITMQIPKGFLI